MVRIISGTLIEVGNGQYPPERVKTILEACNREMAGPTAPAQGLTLMGLNFLIDSQEEKIIRFDNCRWDN